MTDKNLGHATAYGYAKSKGYTGTEEEFAELMASYAEVAESAKGYAEQAEASATNAETSASNAQASATSAGTSASSASASAQTASTKASEASDSATSASESASTAVSAKDDAVTAKEEAETAKADAENAAEEAQESAQTVANKADKDGTYPDMTVGGVMSSDGSTDSTPYLYRESGGGVEVGTVEEDSIVGGTVAFNQLFNKDNFRSTTTANGITFTNNGDGSVKVSGTATALATFIFQPNAFTLRKDHVYLLNTTGLEPNVFMGFDGDSFSLGTAQKRVIKGTADGTAKYSYIRVANGVTVNTVIYPQIFDLTQMFGSSVADYIYSLEQSSTGAGVAFFRKLFPKDYYEYNTGELISVEGLQNHDMVGFNQWDEEWELGLLDADGNQIESTSSIRFKNYMPVFEGTTYFYYNGTCIDIKPWFYDSEKRFIKRYDSYINTNKTFVVPNGCCYMRVAFPTSYGTTYKNDVCINISSDRNGEYEPYIKHSYPLDSSLTLRGIPKVADGKMYYDGDTYEADGTVTRKYGVVTLDGTENWTYSGTTGRGFYTPINSLVKLTDYSHSIVCDRLTVVSSNYAEAYTSGQYMVSGYVDNNNTYPNQNWFYIKTTDDVTSATALKTWLASNPVTVVYELATPTEETAEPYDSIQKVSKYGTEEYVSTGIVPVGHVTKYPTDIVSKVNGLPSDFSTLIAPTESGFKATRAYSVNQFIIVDNQLYRVTSAIANGATITVGTNVVATTVADILTSLLNA